MNREMLIERARRQYLNYGVIDAAIAARLSAEGVIVDELMDSFDAEIDDTEEESV